MSDEKLPGNKAIDAALRLDGNPQEVREFYEDWAENYNQDVTSTGYAGPPIAAKLLSQHLVEKNSKLLDAGCGTGLVGIELNAFGYGDIDGFDLSASMADQASSTGAYRQVRGGIDMMRAAECYAPCRYDAILSVGVFTLGHVPPEALQVLLQLTKPGGLMVISTRSHYYDQTNYQQLVDDLTASNQVKLLQLVKNAPYNNDGDGHYWVFSKPG